MNQPPEWSTLDEAAEWLAGRTGMAWDARGVLNAAIRYPVGDNPAGASNRCTAIGVALPHGHQIQCAVVNVGEGRAYLEKLQLLPAVLKNEPVIPIFHSAWRPVALLQTDVRQLLAAGWIEVATARAWDLIEREPWRIDIVAPPFVARLGDVGITRRRLVELAERWEADQPAGPDGADVCTGDSAPPAADLRSRVKKRADEIALEMKSANSPASSMTIVARKLENEADKQCKGGSTDDLYKGGKGPHKLSWYKSHLIGWQPEK